MKYLLCLFFLYSMSVIAANPLDSIRVELMNGKKVIIHKVDKGQGLNAIARRYNMDVQLIIDANPGKIDKLKKGDILRIPLIKGDSINMQSQEIRKEKVTQPLITDSATKKTGNGKIDESHANADVKETEVVATHIVLAGETVNKIAQKYKITTQQLIKWNGIRDNKLEVGQELIVHGSLIIKPYEKWNTPNSVAPKNNSPKNILASGNVIEETGFAGIGESHLVFHKTAPIGTLLYVTDLDSGKSCYVKVTGVVDKKYDNVILIIDEATLKKLNTSSNILRVQIKYVLP
jgi:peptidoglycan endopeptidase LytF